MSDASRIEWTDATWNTVTGCTKVSPGCDHCYAEMFAERWRGIPDHPYTNGFDLTLRPDRLTLPLRWRRPRRVFVNSMSDLFHDTVPDEHIARVFAVMLAAEHHTFQVLTKRHARMRSVLNSPAFADRVLELAVADYGVLPWRDQDHWWPVPNVWLGVSVENQHWADIRIPALTETPAAVRFLSCEPLLGPLDLSAWLGIEYSDMGLWLAEMFATISGRRPALHWVIVGGESGPAARPIDWWWIGDVIEQCQAAEVPVFVKQLGTAWARLHGGDPKGGDPTCWPADLRLRQFPSTAVSEAA
jgi:protein gp37